MTFFQPREGVTLGALCEHLGCDVPAGADAGLPITSVGPIDAAGEGGLTFIDNPKYLKALSDTKAAAIICGERHADKVPGNLVSIVFSNPYKAFSQALSYMFPTATRPQPVVGFGIAPGAFVDPSAELEDNVTVEHGAVIGPHAKIGSGTLVGPNAVVGQNCIIGRETSISAGASVLNAIIGNHVILHSGVRIGCDGFGFAMGPGGHKKVAQVGRVVIQDHVEIGANTCVDRGSNRDTIIGEGTKIDNLVMIGHNVVIGQHCVIVGQVGIAGSTELKDYVVLGGQAAIGGHLTIGQGAQIAGLSGVSGDVPPGVQWGGVPARPVKHWMREVAQKRREAMAMEKKDGKSDG